MLESSDIKRPCSVSPFVVYRLSWPELFFRLFVKEVRNPKFTNLLGLHLSEVTTEHYCSVWLNMDFENPADALSVYVCSKDAGTASAVCDHLVLVLSPSNCEIVKVIPDEAAPVLARNEAGVLLRLWEAAPPRLPRKQRFKVEGETVEIENRLVRFVDQ